jgi:hypothetical protein
VLSIPPTPSDGNGWAIIRWLAAASVPCGRSGCAVVTASIFRSALASASGSPVSSAPSMSAQYSRPDGAVMCSSTAIRGQDATRDASPADHEEYATSRRATCASSCASTARSSVSVSSRSRPSVQQTAADRALYPTVRILGCDAGDTNSLGTGRCAENASSRTIRYRSGRSTSLTGRARRAASTVRSEWK